MDYSGWSVSLSADGSTVAIGADKRGNGVSGHVRIYRRNPTPGSKSAQTSTEKPLALRRSVSLSADGSTLLLARLNDGNGTDSGHVRIYERNSDGNWEQVGADIDGEAAGDWSGHSVSLSADASTVAIGAAFNGGNGTESGHVRIYQRIQKAWDQVGADIDGEAAYDLSGYSVPSADGKTVAIGAPPTTAMAVIGPCAHL